MIEERLCELIASRRRDVDRLALVELVGFPAGIRKLLSKRDLGEEIKELLSGVTPTRFDIKIKFWVNY